MMGYCLVCKRKVEFQPTNVKKNKNGTITVLGKHKNHFVSRIVKATDAPKI